MKPALTIGLCLHNSEKLLQNALDSIVQQVFPHQQLEVLMVDDGSQDGTLKLAQSFASTTDIRTRVFSIPWHGLGYARNLIVDNAEGEYILWVDADERLTPNYVQSQLGFLEKNPKIGISTGLLRTIPKNLVLNLELIPSIINQKFQLMNKQRDRIWQTNRMPGTGGAVFRVEALREVGGFNTQMRGACEDQEVAQRIQKAGWEIRVNVAEFYELHGGMSNFGHLWKKYVWYGYGSAQVYRNSRTIFSLPRMSPLAGLVTGILYSHLAYKLTHEISVFFLPFHYSLKMTAWMLGFIRYQIVS